MIRCLALIAALCMAGPPALSALESYRTEVAGISRTYHVYRPSGDTPPPYPLVMLLHGGGRGSGERIARQTGLAAFVADRGALVLMPDGLDGNWNDGRDAALVRKRERYRDVDDVLFLSVMIDRMIAEFGVDPGRVLVTGASNGGMMSMRLGCDIPEKLSMIAPVIANLPRNIEARCTGGPPLPALMIFGDADPLMPFEGGHVVYNDNPRGEVLSAMRTLGVWVHRNGCAGRPETVMLPDRDPGDGMRVEQLAYRDCIAALSALIVRGGGHTWPGTDRHGFLMRRILGDTTADVNANAAIWEAFTRLWPNR